MLIDLDEIERRIPSHATECAYCHRLATLVCPVCAVMVCEDHRILAARDAIGTGCEGVAMIPARHDAATMDRVALVVEVRRLRAIAAALAQHETTNGHAHARRAVVEGHREAVARRAEGEALMSPRVVVLEGPDGCGKTAHTDLLAAALREHGYSLRGRAGT